MLKEQSDGLRHLFADVTPVRMGVDDTCQSSGRRAVTCRELRLSSPGLLRLHRSRQDRIGDTMAGDTETRSRPTLEADLEHALVRAVENRLNLANLHRVSKR
jgi:hypothetical protein